MNEKAQGVQGSEKGFAVRGFGESARQGSDYTELVKRDLGLRREQELGVHAKKKHRGEKERLPPGCQTKRQIR